MQFADESTCFVDSESTLNQLLSLPQKFPKWSGLTINKSKSMILFPNKKGFPPSHLLAIPVVESVKILGIWFMTNNLEASQYRWNFKPQLL